MVMISGQFHRDGLLPDLFGDDLAAAVTGLVESPQARRYAEVSPDGPEHYPVAAEKIMRMAFEEPRLDVVELAGVQARTLVVAADDDVVRLEHTLEIYRTIPDAELAVVPGTSHVLIMEKPDLVASWSWTSSPRNRSRRESRSAASDHGTPVPRRRAPDR